MFMDKIIVAGIGTSVGKTIASAILMEALDAAYWKPVQTGSDLDTETVRKLVPEKRMNIYDPTYHLQAPLSPHHAARLENIQIKKELLIPPARAPLIIESVGGILVPLNDRELTIDLFSSWKAAWVIVSRHYIGSINHALLTLEALKARGIIPSLIVFNGDENQDTERAILHFSKAASFVRILPEKKFTQHTIKEYAKKWQKQCAPLRY